MKIYMSLRCKDDLSDLAEKMKELEADIRILPNCIAEDHEFDKEPGNDFPYLADLLMREEE